MQECTGCCAFLCEDGFKIVDRNGDVNKIGLVKFLPIYFFWLHLPSMILSHNSMKLEGFLCSTVKPDGGGESQLPVVWLQ